MENKWHLHTKEMSNIFLKSDSLYKTSIGGVVSLFILLLTIVYLGYQFIILYGKIISVILLERMETSVLKQTYF